MPRRIYTYPADIGWDWLNLISTMGAVVLGIGMFAVVVDVTLHRRRQPKGEVNPWNAGTLEWVSEPEENWGVRSIPRIQSRYPLWDQKNLAEEVKAGDWYLADAREGRRETLVTSVLDAEPEQVLRVSETSLVTIVAASTLGTVFVALTFKWWLVSLVAFIAFVAAVIWWLWTGTGEIPEKDEKDIGRGVSLPLYASGVKSPTRQSWPLPRRSSRSASPTACVPVRNADRVAGAGLAVRTAGRMVMIARSSDPLRSNRAKLEMTMTALDDMGELGPIIRELIHSITLHRDDSGRLGIEVEGYLTPFLQQDGKPLKSDETMGAVAMVAEDRYSQYSAKTQFVC